MKTRIILILTSILLTLHVSGQAPEKFNYQGVARDNAGAPLANQDLGVQISILDGPSAEYVETHTVTTNTFGLYTLAIGDGNPTTGTMAAVTWEVGNKSIKVEIDPEGGTNYSDLGTTELLSVPYALFAGDISEAAGGWSLDGNAPGDDDFIGTTNDAALRFKVDNTEFGFLYDNNTAVGRLTLRYNTTGGVNTAVGADALANNTTGSANSAFGRGTLQNNVSGSNNTAIGSIALYDNGEGFNNTGIGFRALKANTSGYYNTAIGGDALQSNLTGINNTALGYGADVGAADLTNATAIGFKAFVEQDNSLVLGGIEGVNNATQNTNIGIGTTTPSARLDVVGGAKFAGKVGINFDPAEGFDDFTFGGLMLNSYNESDNLSLMVNQTFNRYGYWATSTLLYMLYNGSDIGNFNATTGAYSAISDQRLKQGITPATSLLEKVKDIKIMNYTYKRDPNRKPQIGYIAQDLEKQFPEFVTPPNTDSERETHYTVNYAGMSAVAIRAIQEQQVLIESQEQTIKEQADGLQKMQNQLIELEKRLSALEK